MVKRTSQGRPRSGAHLYAQLSRGRGRKVVLSSEFEARAVMRVDHF